MQEGLLNEVSNVTGKLLSDGSGVLTVDLGLYDVIHVACQMVE